MNYYNDNDPYCCHWLLNLIAEGLLPLGDVDDRPIQEVQPEDVQKYMQCHFFAGLGGWPYATRLAGWPDDRPIWTGSCPCPPFSVAGKKRKCPTCGGSPVPCPRRTGYFICRDCDHAWLADARHLWPEFWRLIAECRPSVVMGEQVSGSDGRIWLAGVRGSLEILGYGLGAVDIPACAVNAPHRRNRLYWMAYASGARRQQDTRSTPANETENGGAGRDRSESGRDHQSSGDGEVCSGPAYAKYSERRAEHQENGDTQGRDGSGGGGAGLQLGHPLSPRLAQREGQRGDASGQCEAAERAGGGDGGVDDAPGTRLPPVSCGTIPSTGIRGAGGSDGRSGDGFWQSWELVGPDPQGKHRRVKPGVFLLADGVPSRVAKLRALGNAIVPPLAAEVIRAWMEICRF